jgi:hypothetical protein
MSGAQQDTISRIYIEYELSAKYKKGKEREREKADQDAQVNERVCELDVTEGQYTSYHRPFG